MKRLFAIATVVAALLFAGKANAQVGVNFGYAPVTITTVTTNNNSTTTSLSEMNGFFAGVTYNYSLGKDLGVAVGLQGRYNIRTSTDTENIVVATIYTKSNTTQILFDVPVLFNYSFPFGGSAKLSAFAGPTFSYSVYGNKHETITTTPVIGNASTTDKDYPIYGDNSNNNRLDVTAALGLQLQYNGIRIFGGYRMGLTDLDTRENVKTTSSGIFLGLGYKM